MDKERAIKLIRLQDRLIYLYQTYIDNSSAFLYIHGIEINKKISMEVKSVREEIERLKEYIYEI